MKTELDKFYGLIDDINVAMMTTRRPDGHLESRAMANQKRADGADLWFVTAEGSGKLRDIDQDPHINLAYYRSGSYEWVSASGLARLSRDRAKIKELYEPDWKVWFGQEGDPRHGTADDPPHRAYRRRRACSGVLGGQQTKARRSVRAGQRLVDGRAHRSWRNAPTQRAASIGTGVHMRAVVCAWKTWAVGCATAA